MLNKNNKNNKNEDIINIIEGNAELQRDFEEKEDN